MDGRQVSARPEAATFPFMRRDSTYFFVDQYNAEFNRTIQPMKGGYTDNYYMQMAENIRRYKGVRPIPVLSGLHPMTIDGDFARLGGQSTSSTAIPSATRSTATTPGYGGLHYKDDSGRNDIVTCKVAVDDDNVYFYAETNEPLTPHTGKTGCSC